MLIIEGREPEHGDLLTRFGKVGNHGGNGIVS